MKLTLIIPTYNGAHKVVNALDSILNQIQMPNEVILVIDGSTDNTKEVIKKYYAIIPNFKVIEQKNSGRSIVRNTGAKEAIGDILFFLDDDMIMPPTCVQAHFLHHQKFSGSLVCGRLEQKLPEGERTEFDVFENWQNSGWNKNLIPESKEEVLLNEPYISANNFSILKKDFVELGMFDPRLNDAEDFDLAVIAKKTGRQIYLSNNCWAWHNDFSAKNFKSYIKRMRQYNFAQKELVRLKPELHGDPNVNKRFPQLPVGLKALFFKSFVHQFYINSLDAGFWKFLPVSIRCKLYDFIITANGTYYPKVEIA